MMWHIDGTRTYLLGSMHMTNMSTIIFPPVMEKVFSESLQIAFETDLDEAIDFSVVSLPDGRKLVDLLPASTYGEIKVHASRLNIPLSNLDNARPIFAGSSLAATNLAHHGYLASQGIDRALWNRAKRDGKKTCGLESAGFQLNTLANVPLDEQVSGLTHLAQQSDLNLSEVVAMLDAWKIGAIAPFESVYAKRATFTPLAAEQILDARNRNWIPQIAEMARNGNPCLVVVGCLHFVGKCGLPMLLEKEGLRLTHCPFI